MLQRYAHFCDQQRRQHDVVALSTQLLAVGD
jgi:hypothetical protein